jgi:hypothetical protein
MSYTLVGHPDWQPTQNTPSPVLQGYENGLTAGTWGPIVIPVSSGGSYLLALQAITSNELAFTDVTVVHQDVNGFGLYSDFFGAVMVGGGTTQQTNLNGPTLIRGNVYGVSLSITGQVATSAWYNTVFGTTGLTASGIDFASYVAPLGLGDPEPKLCNPAGTLNAGVLTAPGGLLFALDSLGIAAGDTSTIAAVIPYSGPTTISYNFGGALTTNTNVVPVISQYTVVNGSTAQSRVVLVPPAMKVGYVVPYDVASCLNTVEITNADATESVTCTMQITADRTS